MDKEFFERKVKGLTDEKLIELVKLSSSGNKEILDLAFDELEKRNIKVDSNALLVEKINVSLVQSDLSKLDQWNWGAFSFSIIWSLTFKLDVWAILSFVPGPNILVKLYLGRKGNLLAFKKSNINSADDFLLLQQGWNRWGKRYFWFLLLIVIIVAIKLFSLLLTLTNKIE